MARDHYTSVIEALLFASDKPISAGKIRGCFDEEESIPVKEIISSLNAHYQNTGRSFFIMEVAGGYQLVTHQVYEPYIKQLYVSSSRMRLSQAALETLAIVAYKQPVSRPEIDAIRGVNSDGVLRTLLDRELIDIKGREEAPGRPLLYGTSEEFLRYFGLNSIKDLPKLKEIDELTLESADLPEDSDVALTEVEDTDTESSATE